MVCFWLLSLLVGVATNRQMCRHNGQSRTEHGLVCPVEGFQLSSYWFLSNHYLLAVLDLYTRLSQVHKLCGKVSVLIRTETIILLQSI
jgi:hypothetical protein